MASKKDLPIAGQAAEVAWKISMQRGLQYLKSGQLHDAEKAFQHACKLVSQRPEAWVNLGTVQLHLNNRQAAAQALATAINLNPNFQAAHSVMGDIQRALGNMELARRCYYNALKIQRDPANLNKLATVIRTLGDGAEAEALYLEAERLAPAFMLPKVNRAIMHIELGRFEQAEEQLQFLEAQTLGPEEREHVRSALIALQARTQLMKPIQALLESGDLPAFHSVLKALPPEQLQIDEFALTPIAHWAEQMQAIRGRHEPLALRPLPEDWVQIEAAHMIPLVDSPASFRATQLNPPIWAGTELQCRQTENMVSAIQLARKHYGLINDPIGSETLIRYLHGTCTRGVSMEGLFPGHFKYTQSRALGHPTARHVLPARASGTWRHVVEVFISTTEPRFERAAFIFLALVSIHPFSDGNGRVALTLMNRELISAGLMPALFSNELGPQGLLGVAEERAHTVGAVDQFLEAVLAGQRHALAFISALEEYDHSQ